MLSNEMRAFGKLAGQAFGRPAEVGRGVHAAVARRAFGALGVLGAPTRVMHDAISNAAYRAVGAGLRAPLRAGAVALAPAAADGVPFADSPSGRLAAGALNGAFGDRLAREYGELALDLSIRHRGRDVVADSPGLAAAFPAATSSLVVFIHGLCETEDAWHLLPLARGERRRESYGSRLRAELGRSPVYVRYNTGLHVSDNGRRLADTLERVVDSWPVEVEEIALVGHSMGGLVARSALHYGAAESHTWTDRVRHVFCLGTPHLGAPLERAANAFGWALGRLPETRPFADLVNGRSAGIKDLRFGNCVEEDWCDCDPDEFLHDRCCEVPFLPAATYYFIGATITREADNRIGALVGDLLVQFPSASGNGPRRRIPFEIENGRHFGGMHHLQLLNHPDVYEQISTWLEKAAVRDPAL